jgi:hypothetical protein
MVSNERIAISIACKETPPTVTHYGFSPCDSPPSPSFCIIPLIPIILYHSPHPHHPVSTDLRSLPPLRHQPQPTTNHSRQSHDTLIHLHQPQPGRGNQDITPIHNHLLHNRLLLLNKFLTSQSSLRLRLNNLLFLLLQTLQSQRGVE